jgi:reductive dehalogenase
LDWNVGTGQVKGLAALGKWNPADLDMSWDDVRRAVKHAALFYGASLAGVARLNPLWLYSDHYPLTSPDPNRAIPVVRDTERFERTPEAWYIPASMNRVVALAFEEDYLALANSPGRLASAAVGNGYSRMAITAYYLAEFIRALGYRALPAGNGVGLSIPMAIDAGLGQLGRMSLLLTPKYGPRVRLAKVITDMPLTSDAPIDFGVVEFCEACKLCAQHCPGGAVAEGGRTLSGESPSNNPGVLKWYSKPERCYDYNGFSCSNCKRVCPFNKPSNSEVHRLTRTIVRARAGVANTVMVSLDQAGGYGAALEATEFWGMDGGRSITAREKM